jgi:DNA-binding transcriptional LysR family regulator
MDARAARTDQPLPNVTVQQLEYLEAVLDAPTWAAAAAGLGVTPSALSQGIAELERRLGIALFDRDGRRRVLRPQAHEAARYATDVLARTRDLARWAEGARAGQAGSMRVGMIDAAAVTHFPDALRRFRDDRPEVDLHLIVAPSGLLLDDLAAGRLDVVVCVAPPHGRPGVDTERLLDEPLAIYAPEGAPRRGGPSTWGPWVTYPTGSHTRDAIERALRRAGAPTAVVAESNQPDVLCEMVRIGLGWSVLPVAQAEAGPRPLTRARRAPLLDRRIVLATRSGAAPDPLATALGDALRSTA